MIDAIDEDKSLHDWIHLNVGGRLFLTTRLSIYIFELSDMFFRSTLLKESGSMLHQMFSTDHIGE
jgi:hypothetical protein